MNFRMIKIKVMGCVAKPGDIELSQEGTVKNAIDLVGGMGNNPENPGLKSNGTISIRRKNSTGMYQAKKTFNVIEEPLCWDYKLENEDLLVVQYDVEEKS